jgi:hypothetical protein
MVTVHKSCLSKNVTGDLVTKERRSVQVWDMNRKAGTGVKRLESEGLIRRLNWMQHFGNEHENQ